MRQSITTLILLLLFHSLAVPTAFALPSHYELPSSSPLYDELEELCLRAGRIGLLPMRPLSVRYLQGLLDEIDAEGKLAPDQQERLEYLRDYLAADAGDDQLFLRAASRLQYYDRGKKGGRLAVKNDMLGPYLTFSFGYEFLASGYFQLQPVLEMRQNLIDYSPRVRKNLPRNRRENRFMVNNGRCYAAAAWRDFSFKFGRDTIAIGPRLFETLGVGENGGYFDQLALRFRRGKFFAYSFIAQLEDYNGLGYLENGRWLIGHGLAVTPFSWLVLALDEYAVHAGERFDLSLANPLLIQHNNYHAKNIFPLARLYLRPLGGVLVYGEFLFDDVRIKYNPEPDIFGYLAGIYSAGRVRRELSLKLQYFYLDKWLGNYGADKRFTQNGRPLGHYLSPDGTGLRGELAWRFSPRLELKALGGHLRRGELDLETTMFDPAYSAFSTPTGVIERTSYGGLALAYRIYGLLELESGWSHYRVRDHGHVSGLTVQGSESWLEAGVGVTF